MAEQFQIEQLKKLITAHIDANEANLEVKRTDTGLFNTTYFVEGAERPLVLRIAPPDDAGYVFYERGMMAQEPAIHKIIRERTSAPVAEIIAYDTSRLVIDRDYLLMQRLPGVPLSQLNTTPQQFDWVLEQTGCYLREIHEITTDKYGYLGEHHCMEPQNNWASAFRIMWNKLVEDVVESGYYDKSEEVYVKGLLDKHYACFDRPVTSRLLHMDIWHQNVLVDESATVTGIVDFDRAVWGDKEIEFAILDYCGMSGPAFWKGYGIERDLSNEAQIRRSFYLLYEIQKYIPINHYRHTENQPCEYFKNKAMDIMKTLQV